MLTGTALIAAIVAAVVPGTTAVVSNAEPAPMERASATIDVAAPASTTYALDAAASAGVATDALSTDALSAEALSAADAGVAPAATGVYQWMCLLSDGRQYFLPAGEPLTNCKGTYLTKYLDGNRLETYRLSAAGEFIAPWNGDLQGCIIAVAALGTGTAALVLSPPTGAAVWFSAASTGLGVLSLSSCVG